MCKNNEKELSSAEAIVEAISEEDIPAERKTHILEALSEVELIRQGKLPRKSAWDLLKELREQDEE